MIDCYTMSKYAGTQTEKNLEAAFAGESQARNKYTYFASKAKKEGFEQIAALFLKTADEDLLGLHVPQQGAIALLVMLLDGGHHAELGRPSGLCLWFGGSDEKEVLSLARLRIPEGC